MPPPPPQLALMTGIRIATSALEWDNHIQNLQMGRYIFQIYSLKPSFTGLLMRYHKTIFLTIYLTDNI